LPSADTSTKGIAARYNRFHGRRTRESTTRGRGSGHGRGSGCYTANVIHKHAPCYTDLAEVNGFGKENG
jgi:hypothetical protein